MELDGGIQGLIHLSEISHGVVKDIREHIQVGQNVSVKIINFEPNEKRIGLSLKALHEAPAGTNEEVKEEKKAPKKEKAKKEETAEVASKEEAAAE
jgi:predicted RNA-binding protein with RPS1 domain